MDRAEPLIRYLFGSQPRHYLSIVDANYNMALTCLKLLSSDCFNEGLPEEVMRTNILCGAYVLQNYTVSQWLEHVRNIVGQREYSESFP